MNKKKQKHNKRQTFTMEQMDSIRGWFFQVDELCELVQELRNKMYFFLKEFDTE